MNSIKAPKVIDDVRLPMNVLVDSLVKAIDALITKHNTLLALKKVNTNSQYINTKLSEIQDFGVNVSTVALLHDPHTFFSGRSLEAIRTLLVDDVGVLNTLMTFNHQYYSELALLNISNEQVLSWFNTYYSSMQMTDENFSLLSKESISMINEPKADAILNSNVWLLPLFLLVLNPKLVDKFTYISQV